MAYHDKIETRSAESVPLNVQADSGSDSRSLEAAMMQERNPLKRFSKMPGPGLITGASDGDPSGIGTYAVTGASLGFSTLWTALFALFCDVGSWRLLGCADWLTVSSRSFVRTVATTALTAVTAPQEIARRENDRLMSIINRLGSRVEVKVRVRRAAPAAREVMAAE